MAGLGIDFGSLESAGDAAASTRRRAHLEQGTPGRARLPCAPLRENRSATNTPAKRVFSAQTHQLPPKPDVAGTRGKDVQAARVTLREDTPSEAGTPPGAKASTPLTVHHAQMAVPFYPSTPVAHTPQRAMGLPAKPQSTPMLPLERDARVKVDLFLDEDRAVEGGYVQGFLRLRLPPHTSPETAMLVAQPRVRLIGFETFPGEDVRHVFYHHASVIDGDRSVDGPSEPYVLHGSPAPPLSGAGLLPCYASLPDAEGYYLGKEGTHVLPFTLQLPVGRGAKGSYRSDRAEVGYIAIASVRVRAFGEQQGKIAHCFHKMELYPYLNPNEVLASALRPIVHHATSQGKALVRLAAALHRESWVAGQRVYFDMSVATRTRVPMHLLRISLLCTETLYRATEQGHEGESTASSSTRTLLQETLDASSDHPSAHGWAGVPPGRPVHFGHFLVLPSDALSIEKGRHVQVHYTLRLGVGNGTAPWTCVELPVRIVHFVSLDPPPARRTLTGAGLLGLESGQEAAEAPSPCVGVSASGHLLPSPATPANRAAQHHRSLDFINSAIRSATARHYSPYAPSPLDTSGLGIDMGRATPRSIRPPSWYLAESRRMADASLDIPASFPEIDEPTSDTSLELGDETNDDVVLVFDPPREHTTPPHDTTMETEGVESLCHAILDSYGDTSQDTSSASSLTPPTKAAAQCSTPQRAGSPARERPATRAGFAFATSASPLKVKGASAGPSPVRQRTRTPSLLREKSATALPRLVRRGAAEHRLDAHPPP